MSDAQTLFDSLLALQTGKRLPPVHQWQPARTGNIDIRIAADGAWYHEGSPIRRQAMVKLFSTILRKDPDGFCLVTPAERLMIEVEDAPFLGVDMERKGAGEDAELLFVTNVDDVVIADADHPLVVRDQNGEPRPYVEVRDGLEALINRPVFYRLVEAAFPEHGELWVCSRGARFSLGHV